MSDRTPIILVTRLRPGKGGRTQAIIKRANTLLEKYRDVKIITMHYQPQFQEDIERVYKENNLNKKVQVVNFFEELKKSKNISFFSSNKKSIKNINNAGLTKVEQSKGENNEFFYYKNGLPLKKERYDKNNRLVFIEYMNETNNVYRKEEYDDRGKVSRIVHIDPIMKKPNLYRYMDKKGRCYLSVEINPENGKEGFSLYFNKKTKHFSSLFRLEANWLEKFLDNILNPVVYCEARRLDKLLSSINHKSLKKAVVLHSTHLAKPYNDKSKIRNAYKGVFRRANKFDTIVVLTEEQKRDIEEIFDFKTDIVAIPHAYELTSKKKSYKKVARDDRTVITMARYHKVKRIHEAIKAFSYVVKEVPNAQYHIYGSGPLEKSLQKLIKKLKLENNVILKGYCSEPSLAYKSAICSILTSQYEGFGMVIAESMAFGTPVVAYDIKYGPSEMIKDGENGYLVPDGNKRQLANKIINILKSPSLQKQLSNKSHEIRESFSEKRYKNNWIKLTETI